MEEVLLDALKDSAIVLGVLFVLHVLLSFFEGKVARLLEKSERFAPAAGAVFGLIPECGSSVVGADLYIKDHLTMGTLVAIFLACSDEALPILFANFSSTWYMSFVLIGLKIAIGIATGVTVDFFLRKKNAHVEEHLHHCEGEEANHVGCCGHAIEEESAWKEHLFHPIVHSLKIFAYVFVLNIAFGALFHYVGEEATMHWLASNRAFSPLMAAAVGLIPNCASSVLLAETYLEGALPFGALLAGLLVNAGIGMFVLLKNKEKRKDALIVTGICLAVSIASGYAFLFI